MLIYEGHNIPARKGRPNPKTVDQPLRNPAGTIAQNGLFYDAAKGYKRGEREPELVKVYEKLKPRIWTFNGLFKLVDAWQEISRGRTVFKFRLELVETTPVGRQSGLRQLEHNRVIPTSVKVAVWKRDKGRCVVCGSRDDLHFDHIIPYARGGSSLVPENIQILCARHNLEKRDRIK